MGQVLLVAIAILAGILLDVLSNWIYDLLKAKGVFPDKPSLKRSLLVVLFLIPVLILVILPEVISRDSRAHTSIELIEEGAYVEIKSVVPSVESAVFYSGREVPVIVLASYNLPSNAVSPVINLEYLTSYKANEPEQINWRVIHTLPAEIGVHRVRLAGSVVAPHPSTLNGEPFQLAVVMNVLDKDTGHTAKVASDNIQLPLSLTATLVSEPTPCYSCIAFVLGSEENAEIYVMNAGSAPFEPTRLTTNRAIDDVPKWSPGGQRIVFESQRDGNPEIYIMNADGTEQFRLTTDASDDKCPVWSPDGKRIAYISSRDNNSEIYTVTADGREQTRLTTSQANDGCPVWSPDGSHIAWVSDMALYVMNWDGTDQSRLTDGDAWLSDPAWSPDSQKIAFVARRQYPLYFDDPRLYSVNSDGTHRAGLGSQIYTRSPKWSPNGQKIAFTALAEADSFEGARWEQVYTINADGSGEAQLTNGAYTKKYFEWSPDGDRVASVDGDSMNVATIETGNSHSLLIMGGGIHHLAWSADGR